MPKIHAISKLNLHNRGNGPLFEGGLLNGRTQYIYCWPYQSLKHLLGQSRIFVFVRKAIYDMRAHQVHVICMTVCMDLQMMFTYVATCVVGSCYDGIYEVIAA